jgi:PAS domain S-box-containing protein
MRAGETVEESRETTEELLEELRREKALSDLIIESLPGFFWLFDEQGRRVRWNRATAELLGLTDEEMRALHPLAPLIEEDRAMVAERIERIFRDGVSEPSVFRALDKDGELRTIFGTGLLLTFGEQKYVVGTGVDITAQKRAEEELRRALAEIKRLKERLEVDNVYLREELGALQGQGSMIAESANMREVMAQAAQVAATDSSVLITGETGTGKELVAGAIHNMSSRRDRPLVVVNCAAMPSTLVENELFGREKGAYTGALTQQRGRFEIASGATIFLDEIGELEPGTQAKLLRVLQEGQLERLGSSRTIKVDVRIIAATNRDLEREVAEGRFREDLYYRLAVFPIQIPPLRERREDIPRLVWAFVKELGEKMGKKIESVPRPTLEALKSALWPGNVRELKNVIERAMICSTGPVLKVEVPARPAINGSSDRPMTLRDLERRHVLKVLELTGWRVRGENGAAEILGLKPSTLESRMARLEIRRPGKTR